MLVLGIESSCDETAVAIYDSERGLLAHALYSQISLHQAFGGVVPELASRDHIKHLVHLVDQALAQAKIEKHHLNAIAYTAGPGLMGALLTGACFAKSLSFSLNIPALAVHHLEAHILAAKLATPGLQFPFLALLVSGGHTQLIYAHHLGHYELLGDTLDDAVGEAFDKTAKLMGIPYPGGAMLASLADSCPDEYKTLPPFPRPMIDRAGFDFSFSGLKTHALNVWTKSNKEDSTRQAVAFAFQQAVVDTLLIKCQKAIKHTNAMQLVVAGGVGANKSLRQALMTYMISRNGNAFFPAQEFCTDNGAMIAYTGWLYLTQGKQDTNQSVEVKARWPLSV